MSYRNVRWQDDAACIGEPLEKFFPGRGDLGAQAKKICETCRVRPECLEDARNHDAYGVWGGERFA